MLKYFDKKPFLGNTDDLQSFDQVQLSNSIQQDIEKLSDIPYTDKEILKLDYTRKARIIRGL